jgi:hypothetical protein
MESFNGRMRDACLKEHLFDCLRHDRNLIAAWRTDFTHHRPHKSLTGLTPVEYANQSRKDQNLNRTNLNSRIQRAEGQNAWVGLIRLGRCCKHRRTEARSIGSKRFLPLEKLSTFIWPGSHHGLPGFS